MRTETILDAMVKAELDRTDVRKRQIAAFRARILRMDAEKADVIEHLRIVLNDCDIEITAKDDRIERLENDLSQCVQWKDKQIAELVQRIAELEKEIYRERQMKEIAYVRIAELEQEVREYQSGYRLP